MLYDRIVVAPSTMPEMHCMVGEDHAVSPHWRRGHFRMQTMESAIRNAN